jgi:hypothetical protein
MSIEEEVIIEFSRLYRAAERKLKQDQLGELFYD